MSTSSCSGGSDPVDPTVAMEGSAVGAHASFMDSLVDAVLFSSADHSPTPSESFSSSKPSPKTASPRRSLVMWNGTHLLVDSIDEWTIRLDGRLRRRDHDGSVREPRSFAAELRGLVRDRVNFRVGRIVYLAFSRDEEIMGTVSEGRTPKP